VVQLHNATLLELHGTFHRQGVVSEGPMPPNPVSARRKYNIMEAFEATLDFWYLPVENHVCLTTDNDTNIVAAAERQDRVRLSFLATS